MAPALDETIGVHLRLAHIGLIIFHNFWQEMAFNQSSYRTLLSLHARDDNEHNNTLSIARILIGRGND